MKTAAPNTRLLLRRVLLIGAMLLFAETAAAAHELKHALHATDDLSCQLHLFADHFAKTPAADTGLAPAPAAHDNVPPSPQAVTISHGRTSLYRPRAPPISS